LCQKTFKPNRVEMKNKKQNQFVHIGTILPGLLKQCRRKPDSELVKIWDVWDEIAGRMIAENAKPAAFKGDLVLVHVESPTWVHHLQFLKQDLILKINQALGKPLVKDIKFKIGPV